MHAKHCSYAAATTKTGKYCVSPVDRKSTRLNSSHSQISYAVFCLKKKNNRRRVSVKDIHRNSLPIVALTHRTDPEHVATIQPGCATTCYRHARPIMHRTRSVVCGH